jgi:2-polyprenyl-3-methyl-5-hydroxy-6-metoxy-1,4-benzoquinol methylase
MMTHFCTVCNKVHKKDFIKLPISEFITSDYKKINAKKKYYFCHETNFFVTDSNISWEKNINRIYQKYKFNKKGIFKDILTREDKIVSLIKKFKTNTDEILEIGPGQEGVLLKKLNLLKNIKKIDVCDVNYKSLIAIKKIDKFEKFYINLNKIKKKYDLIILSHSFFHIIELNNFTKKIKNLLKPNGNILLITPEPLKYPILPYVYEVYSFSSKRNVINYFKKFNLFLKKDFQFVLKNEIVILLSKKRIKTIKSDQKFLGKYNNIQKKFFLLLKKYKKQKALIIHGGGLVGKFLYFIFKKKVFKIYDDNIVINLKINKKLAKIKPKKIIKTFNLPLK